MNRPMATHRRKPGANPFKKRLIKKAERPIVEQKEPDRFRVLIAVNRPRYRSRSERAVDLPGWETRSLLNREDPIGIMNQKPPQILILSADFGRNKNLGYLKAAQRFRSPETRIVGLFEDGVSAAEAADLCDVTFSPPWKSLELRGAAARLFEEITGHSAPLAAAHVDSEPDED